MVALHAQLLVYFSCDDRTQSIRHNLLLQHRGPTGRRGSFRCQTCAVVNINVHQMASFTLFGVRVAGVSLFCVRMDRCKRRALQTALEHLKDNALTDKGGYFSVKISHIDKRDR